jgi:hypothetical protein
MSVAVSLPTEAVLAKGADGPVQAAVTHPEPSVSPTALKPGPMKFQAMASIQKHLHLVEEGLSQSYQVCHKLVEEVQQLFQESHHMEAVYCLRLIESTYACTHSKQLKIAIENIFLYRLGTFIFGSGERNRLLKMVPSVLREHIMRQALVSGI